jgi:hypothetical protein
MADVDFKAFEAEVNGYSVKEVRAAMNQVGEHPLRGEEKGHAAYRGQGKVKDGEPRPGVCVRYRSGLYHFELTVVWRNQYTRHTVAMNRDSFSGFVLAMLDLLRHSR